MKFGRVLFSFVSVGFALTAFSGSASASVWQTRAQWSDAQEQAYSAWANVHWVADIFSNPSSPYYGIQTDCADAFYTERMIYAYENGLPYAVKDPSGGTNKITNDMSRFDSISDPKRRFFAFANYVQEITGTYTVPEDTYPVAVSRSTVKVGGTMFYYRYHTLPIKTIHDNGVIEFLNSTVPREVRELETTIGFEEGQPFHAPDDGLRWFRQPQYIGPISGRAVPGYSEEQFHYMDSNNDGSDGAWATAIQNRLAITVETQSDKVDRALSSLCDSVQQRVEIVNDALQYQQQQGGACMDASDYYNYSTPDRDARISKLVDTVNQLVTGDNADYVNRRNNTYNNSCIINYGPGKSVTLGDFLQRLAAGQVSSDPNDSLAARWGELSVASVNAARHCQEYSSDNN